MSQNASNYLFESIVQHSDDLITVFDERGTVVFINDAAERLLGAPAASLLGVNILDFVHPDERGRAITTMDVVRDFGPAPGATHFRLRHADGSYVALELTSGWATDGERRLLTTSARPSETRDGLERAMMQLVDGSTIADIMLTVCDTVSWRGMRSRIGITWQDASGIVQRVTQGGPIPEALWGGAPNGGFIDELRRSGERRQSHDLGTLPTELRQLAETSALGGYWLEPVRVGDHSALIAVWTVAGGHPPTVHVQGMQLARNIVEVILRWTDQQTRLAHAADHDELTGLPNRKPFFRALTGAVHGAILYCDLDDFKPVNDRFGHAAGDTILRQVAERLRGCVREQDLVARIGGDEFAVLCPWSSAMDADALAARIRDAITPPFTIGDTSVAVSISVGIAHTTTGLDEQSVADADRLLREAKAHRQASR